MQQFEQFIKKLIEESFKFELSLEDKKSIKIQGLNNFIFKKLSSTKFKASSIPNELENKVKEKIQYCLENNLPIHITVPFGGFKKWQLPSYPEIDWAEVFNILLLIQYLLPISKSYPKGVLLEYYSDEIFISKMNNYSQEELNIYNNQFSKLIGFFSEIAPENFQLKFSKIRDHISQDALMTRFDKTIVELKSKWISLPKQEREKRIKKSERNYKGNLSNIPELEKNKILFESTLIHDAFIFGGWDLDIPWAFDVDMIAIGFRYTNSWGIHLKSSRSSTVQFWVGTGVLVMKNNELIPTILSYNQYLEVKSKLQEYPINIFDKTFKNLQTIAVLNN